MDTRPLLFGSSSPSSQDADVLYRAEIPDLGPVGMTVVGSGTFPPVVSRVQPGSQAAMAGVRRRSRLLRINDVDCTGMGHEAVKEKVLASGRPLVFHFAHPANACEGI